MNSERIIIVVLAIALVVGVALLFFSLAGFFTPRLENNAQNFQQFSSKENPADICGVPPGTDPQQWKEHLSHHPDKYSQCLK